MTQSLKVASTSTVELSAKGIEYLQLMFNKHDRDRDGVLSHDELVDMFAVCAVKTPWGKDVHNTVETNAANQLTYAGFFSQWVYVTS